VGVNHPWVAVRKLQDISVRTSRSLGAGRSRRFLARARRRGRLPEHRHDGRLGVATLLEASARAELALLPRRTITPVVSLGGGGYRLKSGDNGGGAIYHTNLFWSAGPVWMQRCPQR